MTKKTYKEGDKVRVIQMAYGSGGLEKGDIAYVTYVGLSNDSRNYLAVTKYEDKTSPGSNESGGNWCAKWEDIGPLDSLDDEAKQALTDAALAAATARGYCAETKKVLADLGLPTEPTPETKKVTVEIEYTVKDGYSFHPSNLVYEDAHTRNGAPVITIVKATKPQDTIANASDEW